MEEIMICPFCGREGFKRKCDFSRHVNYCKMNPNRVEVSEETRKKLSVALKGKNKGKTHSEETRKKLSETQKIVQNRPEVKQKHNEALKKVHENPEYRQKLSEALKGKKHSDEHRQKISKATKKRYVDTEERKKTSFALKRKWSDYDYKQKQIDVFNSKAYQQKRYDTMKQNNSFNSSKIEEQLKEYFIINNINFKTQYKSDKYPFMCDFYFPDKDLYVEIQGTWTHGGKPFDASDIGCVNQLALWKSKNKPFYLSAIDTWTNRDVRKRNYAKEHKLNWIEIFSDNLNVCLEIITKLL